MSEFAETAYAKINLALHVRRRRSDGYHDIETLFAFVEAGDSLTAEPADDLELDIVGPFAQGLASDGDNLVLKTAHVLQRHYGIGTGAHIGLDKRLPVASGIGGGSADAAATARLLNDLWGIGASQAELAALLAPLGADIPACVRSETAIGRGTGTDLEIVADSELGQMPVLLVNPRVSVSTAAIFRAWDGIDCGPLAQGTLNDVMQQGRNDLQPMAIAICPEIGDVLARLEGTSSLLARMSGSGATCFALFASPDARDRAEQEVAKACPDWWTMSSFLR